jgi:NAD(P)H-hydrate epimerase
MHLTRDQVRRVDQIAIHDYAIPGVVLMENAGRGCAQAILQILAEKHGTPAGRSAVILCGGGNNGGDGYVIARHLHNAGVGVAIHSVVEASKLTGDAGINRTIIDKMALPVSEILDAAALKTATIGWSKADAIVDALLGTGFTGALRPHMAAVIKACNEAAASGPVPIIAVDLPSGLDCDTGAAASETIRATMTATFVAEKVGFHVPGTEPYTGKILVVDIGAPPEALQKAISAKK